MIEFPILSLMTALPLVGALFIFMIRGDEQTVARNARFTALYTSIFVFALSLYLLGRFDGSSAEFQFVEQASWFPSLGISYHMGVDGISIFFVALSALLTPICIL